MSTISNIHVDVPNAPDLVLDLLAAYGETLPGLVLRRAGALLDHREATTSVAITRLLSEGKIRRMARGLYALNQTGLSMADELHAWRREATVEVPWSGGWVAVHDAAVHRSDKTAWRRHQLALSLRGFAILDHGLHLRPDNRRGGVAAERAKLHALGLSPHARVSSLSDLGIPNKALARQLWDLDALDLHYRSLLKGLNDHLKGLHRLPIEQALRESLLLGRTAMVTLIRDPMLPRELMSSSSRTGLIEAVHRYKREGHQLWTQWLFAATEHP